MGMLAARACANSGCYTTRLQGSKFCAKHQNYAAEQDKRRKVANPLWPLYKCKKWYQTRAHVLARDPQCTEIVNGIQCPRLSTDACHVVEAQQWMAQGGDFYDQENIRGKCHPHHSRETAREQGFASGLD
jgi:hypothetical protein